MSRRFIEWKLAKIENVQKQSYAGIRHTLLQTVDIFDECLFLYSGSSTSVLMHRGPGGSMNRIRLHFLVAGDWIHLPTGLVRPAKGKEPLLEASTYERRHTETIWDGNAVSDRLCQLALSGASASMRGSDENFDITFERTSLSEVWWGSDQVEVHG